MALVDYEISGKVMRAIDLISQGQTVSKACAAVGITVMVFQRTLKDVDELSMLYDEAQQVGHDALADKLIDIVELCNHTNAANEKELSIAAANVKWLLERRDKQRFGNEVTVTHNITADKAIVNALQRGIERATAKRLEQASNTEDADFTVIEPAFNIDDFL